MQDTATLHKCDDCEQTFKRAFQLVLHKSRHTATNSHRHSRQPDSEFSTTKPPESYACESRDRVFKHLLRRHETSTPHESFNCDQCDATFCDADELTVHEQTHSPIASFACHRFRFV